MGSRQGRPAKCSVCAGTAAAPAIPSPAYATLGVVQVQRAPCLKLVLSASSAAAAQRSATPSCSMLAVLRLHRCAACLPAYATIWRPFETGDLHGCQCTVFAAVIFGGHSKHLYVNWCDAPGRRSQPIVQGGTLAVHTVADQEQHGQQHGMHNQLLPPVEAVGCKGDLILEPQHADAPATVPRAQCLAKRRI